MVEWTETEKYVTRLSCTKITTGAFSLTPYKKMRYTRCDRIVTQLAGMEKIVTAKCDNREGGMSDDRRTGAALDKGLSRPIPDGGIASYNATRY